MKLSKSFNNNGGNLDTVAVEEVGKLLGNVITAAKEYSIEKLRNETERQRIRAFLIANLKLIQDNRILLIR